MYFLNYYIFQRLRWLYLKLFPCVWNCWSYQDVGGTLVQTLLSSSLHVNINDVDNNLTVLHFIVFLKAHSKTLSVKIP